MLIAVMQDLQAKLKADSEKDIILPAKKADKGDKGDKMIGG